MFYREMDGGIGHIFDTARNQLFRDQWAILAGAPAAAGDPVTMDLADRRW
jgi:hypothetical protein